MRAVTQDRLGLLPAVAGDGRPLLLLSATFLGGCGLFAILQAATGHLLPHDTAHLGMTGADLCTVADCRILHFMIHDRISFGGVLVAIAVVYAWLALFPLAGGESWAWWTLAASGATGFTSFLAYLGYGYLDSWHGIATLSLLPLVAAGLARTRWARVRVAAAPLHLRSAGGTGRALLLLSAVGIAVAGVVITGVGMTVVFVPQDLHYIGRSRESIEAVAAALVPVIAHDRAGFGGALASFGVAMVGCVRYGRPGRALWQALGIAGAVGFGTAIGVHPAIGYVDAVHLSPALLGCLLFAAGLVLAATAPRTSATLGLPPFVGAKQRLLATTLPATGAPTRRSRPGGASMANSTGGSR
jgi:hypothetical protein